MIEAIANLLKESNAQHMQLMIRVNENGTISIIANTALKPSQGNESKEAMGLRSVLTNPLCISGEIGEIDVTFNEELTGYRNAFEPAAIQHSNMLDVKAIIEKGKKDAEKAAPSQSKATKTQNDKPISEAKGTEQEVKVQSQPTTSSFLNEDADSL